MPDPEKTIDIKGKPTPYRVYPMHDEKQNKPYWIGTCKGLMISADTPEEAEKQIIEAVNKLKPYL